MNAEIEKMAAMYGMPVEQVKEYVGADEGLKRQIAITKAVDYIMANVKEKAKAKPKKDAEAEVATEE